MMCCAVFHREVATQARWHVLVPAKPKRPTTLMGADGKGDARAFDQVCDGCLLERIETWTERYPDARIRVWRIA